MKKTSFYVVQSWMASELQLSGLQLLIFAIIYGFSKDGRSKFYGSLNYIASQANCSSRTVVSIISKLVDQKIICKESGLSKEGNKENMYYVLVDYDALNDSIVNIREDKVNSDPYEISAQALGSNYISPYEISAQAPIIDIKGNNTNGENEETKGKKQEELFPSLNTEPKAKEKENGWAKKEKEFLDKYNETRTEIRGKESNVRVVDNKAKKQLKAAIKNGYSISDLMDVFKNASQEENHHSSGFKWLTMEFITRQDKINLYIERIEPEMSHELNKNGDFD